MGYLVDQENKIILKKGALISAGANCPIGMIEHTNFHHLYLSVPNMKFPHTTDEADIAIYINGRANFLLFKAKNLMMKQKNLLQR